MKKLPILCLIGTILGISLVSCGGTDSKNEDPVDPNPTPTVVEKYNFTFDLNYTGGENTVVEVEKNKTVTKIADPSRDGYTFEGWFEAKDGSGDAFDFSTAIVADTTVYAKWEEVPAAVYNFTFDLNYEGSTATVVEVTEGEKVTQIADPSRDGYNFEGWYLDKDANAEDESASPFDFDTAITADTTVYAIWSEVSVDDTNITMKFMWNYDDAPDGGVYETKTIVSGKKLAKPKTDPSREGYIFYGWYTDLDCTTSAKFNTRYSVATTFYACWYKQYTFEAEHVDFTGKSGNGFSGNANGTEMIEKDTKDAGASNGYYVSYLYYNGAFLDFYINSAEDVATAILSLRLSVEFYDITSLSSDNFGIYVNCDCDDYSENDPHEVTGYNIALTGAYDVSSSNLRAFQDYEISRAVSLKKGENIITLRVENAVSHGGTLHAEAPLIDCMKLATKSSELSWGEGYPLESNTASR